MGNFVFSDGEYENLARAYKLLFSRLAETHAQYTNTLATLVESGISSGRVARNLMTFHKTAQGVGNEFNTIDPIIVSAVEEAMNDISRADSRE